MTDLLQRGAGGSRAPAADVVPRPVAVSACAVSGAVAVGGLIVAFGLAMIAWLAGSGGSTGTALRAGAAGWLVSHGSAVSVSGTAVTAVPLGAVLGIALAYFMLARKLCATTNIRGPRDVLVFGLIAGSSYAVLLALGAWSSSVEEVAVGPVRAAAVGFALAAVSGTLAAARQSGVLARWWQARTEHARAVARGAGYASAAMLAAGVTLATVMLLADTATFGAIWSGLDAGIIGGAGLVLVCLALAPNIALWSVAVLLGPGVAIGVDTQVSLTTVSLGRIPGLPLLAALPDPGTQPGWATALAALPVLSGVLGGYVACSKSSNQSWTRSVGRGVSSGALAGLVCGLMVAASAGSVGPGRMAHAGPDVLLCLGAAVVSLTVGGATGALLGHYRVARAHDRAG